MNNLKLNETPIRTSRNFNINNIKLENIKIPDTINKFNNITITGNSSLISNNTSNIKLTYGIEEELINQINQAIEGNDVSFSNFVIQACQYALDNIEEETTYDDL